MSQSGGRGRALEIMEAGLHTELNERAGRYATHLGEFHFAEAAARALEDQVTGQEGALRAWLAGEQRSLDVGMLRMFHAAIDLGRVEHASAAKVYKEAEVRLEGSRGELFDSLKRRSKLREVRRRKQREGLQLETRREAVELDEQWLQNRSSRI